MSCDVLLRCMSDRYGQSWLMVQLYGVTKHIYFRKCDDSCNIISDDKVIVANDLYCCLAAALLIRELLTCDITFPTMWYLRPAKPQISLRIRTV